MKSTILFLLVFSMFAHAQPVEKRSEAEEKQARSFALIDAGDYVNAVPLVREAAEAGLPRSQYNYALFLLEGTGVAVDEVLANVYLRKAAEQNFVDAQYKLAHSYRMGRGTAVREDSALYWYRRAAELGDMDAGWNLGMAYVTGYGMMPDTLMGVSWFERTALQIPHAPDTTAGSMTVNGTQVSAPVISFSKQRADILKVRINLMQLYLGGELLQKDTLRAYIWSLLANELKAEMPVSYQTQLNNYIKNLEGYFTEPVRAEAKAEAERLLKRPLEHYAKRFDFVLDE